MGEVMFHNAKCYDTFMADTAFDNVKCYHTFIGDMVFHNIKWHPTLLDDTALAMHTRFRDTVYAYEHEEDVWDNHYNDSLNWYISECDRDR